MRKVKLSNILQRLERLENHIAIRNCLNRYMEICDTLDANTDLNELMSLFDDKSRWEGVGEKYAQTFGCYNSWQAIYEMFKHYTREESHFSMNAHFMTSEQIIVKKKRAIGTWLMLQTSTFHNGNSHLNAAKLKITFKKQSDGTWKIKHFQTRNIFSRPITHWNSNEILPVPNR